MRVQSSGLRDTGVTRQGRAERSCDRAVRRTTQSDVTSPPRAACSCRGTVRPIRS